MLWFWPNILSAQTAESKLAALEKVAPQERQQRLYELAKNEGEAVIYANMDVSAMKPLTDGFMKRYPGTKAASVHFSGAAIITRLDVEARAGKPVSDVVLSGQSATIPPTGATRNTGIWLAKPAAPSNSADPVRR